MIKFKIRRLMTLILLGLPFLMPAAVFAQEEPDRAVGAAIGLMIIGIALLVTAIAVIGALIMLGVFGLGAAGPSEDG